MAIRSAIYPMLAMWAHYSFSAAIASPEQTMSMVDTSGVMVWTPGSESVTDYVPSETDPAATGTKRRISQITIENGDVIPHWSDEWRSVPNDAVEFGYELTNAVHIATRRGIVERELLFAVGDTLDSLRLMETERNLRRHSFISDARVSVVPDGHNGSEVLVRTTDNFSLGGGVAYQRAGQYSSTSFSVQESNLFGYGKSIGAGYTSEKGGDSWSLSYHDPQFLRSRWMVSSGYTRLSYGNTIRLQAVRPFRSARSTTSRGGYFTGYFSEASYFAKGLGVVQVPQRSVVTGVWNSWASGAPRLRQVSTVRLRYANVYMPRDAYESTGLIRTRYEALGEVGLEGLDGYHRRRYLDDYRVAEDIRAGWKLRFGLGSGMLTGRTASPYGLAEVYTGWTHVNGDHITAMSGTGSTRMWENHGQGREVWSHLLTRAWLHHYYMGLPGQTLAASVNWYGVWRQDDTFWTGLGARNGLRGYAPYRFGGTRRFLLNVEDRLFVPWSLMTIGFAAVGFFDAGYVWRENDHVNLRDLRADAGFGMRIYNTRAPTARVTRIDWAYPLRDNGGWQITIGTEQTFDLPNHRGATLY
jgi:hypothetical protein